MKVKICGIPYEVIDKECIESGNGRCLGQITYDECIIEMRKVSTLIIIGRHLSTRSFTVCL